MIRAHLEMTRVHLEGGCDDQAVADPEGGLKSYSQFIFTIYGTDNALYGEN